MPSQEITFTIRKPPYTYLHIFTTSSTTTTTSRVPQHASHSQSQSQSQPQSQPLDEITLRTYLTASLTQYLGLTGAAIPIDILKVDGPRNEGWLRLLREDESAVIAALAQWVGRGGVVVRVRGRGSWLGGLVDAGGGDGNGDGNLWSLER